MNLELNQENLVKGKTFSPQRTQRAAEKYEDMERT
jgi:hypothetical protein